MVFIRANIHKGKIKVAAVVGISCYHNLAVRRLYAKSKGIIITTSNRCGTMPPVPKPVSMVPSVLYLTRAKSKLLPLSELPATTILPSGWMPRA